MDTILLIINGIFAFLSLCAASVSLFYPTIDQWNERRKKRKIEKHNGQGK